MEKYKLKAEKKETETQLNFSGDLTLNNVEAIKKDIISLIKDATKIKVEIRKVTNIDLSFIQLLYSMKKQFKENITFDIELPETLKSMMENAGFSNYQTLED